MKQFFLAALAAACLAGCNVGTESTTTITPANNPEAAASPTGSSGAGDPGIAPMAGSGATGGVTPMSGTENIGGTTGGGIGQAAKDQARSAAGAAGAGSAGQADLSGE